VPLGSPLPLLGFGLWHLAPRSVSRSTHPGGMLSFVAVAMVFGLCWGWVAYRAASIRWVVVSHVLLDFAGLGALVYFR
jgi:membrane protease YdiL (CAAX protease family)